MVYKLVPGFTKNFCIDWYGYGYGKFL